MINVLFWVVGSVCIVWCLIDIREEYWDYQEKQSILEQWRESGKH